MEGWERLWDIEFQWRLEFGEQCFYERHVKLVILFVDDNAVPNNGYEGDLVYLPWFQLVRMSFPSGNDTPAH